MSGITVTATGSGATAVGIHLQVQVLNNAILPAKANGVQASETSGAFIPQVAITPAATGSLAYSATILTSNAAVSATAGNTIISSTTDSTHFLAHGALVSSSTLTAGTAVTAGSSNSGVNGSVAAMEVQSFGGAIAVDGSSPAAVSNIGLTTISTAAFTPPLGNKLIVAMTSTGGGGGQAAMKLSDSYGLTWTEAAAGNVAGRFYAGVWFAYSPAVMTFTAAAPVAGTVGTAYSYTFGVTGGFTGYTWAVTTGSLPGGLSLSSAGVITGTPTTAGLSTFAVTATDQFGSTLLSGSLSIVISKSFAGTGFIRTGWTAAAPAYFYGTLPVAVATTDHDWTFVSVSWLASEDAGIAYVSDNVHNDYQSVAFTASSHVNTQVFAVPNARATSTVYVGTSAFARWLTVQVLGVTGLQPGLTVDAVQVYSGGPGTSNVMSLPTTRTDLVLAFGAFAGTPQTLTQTGTGAAWTALYGGVNGTSSAGITQTSAWASVSGASTPAMTFTGASGYYSGVMIAMLTQGGLPLNSNPAWPVLTCQAAFGYLPQEPTTTPTWTDITSRFLGLDGTRGRSFELDEIAAADMTITLDNYDGALSPQNTGSPYYPNVTLVTPVQVTATWQGRTYMLFKGIITALPQTYDFQRGVVKVASTDDFSKLALSLLAPCMIQEMLYDKPVSLWPLNEQQGAPYASNWSGRSTATLVPTNGLYGGGTLNNTPATVSVFGIPVPVVTHTVTLQSLFAPKITSAPAASTAVTGPTTGFGGANGAAYPAGLAGTQDSSWGNTGVTTNVGGTTYYQASVLVDSADATLPLTSTGATYSLWAQMTFIAANITTGAVLMALTDVNGTSGSGEYLTLTYDGTNVNVIQTAGTHSFAPSGYLFDSKWHLWTVTVTTGGVITVYLDAVQVGSFTGTFPGGTPSKLQLGGDVSVNPTAAAGIFTGSMALAGAYDRVVDLERILSWFLSGSTGFLDELAGARAQRILNWTRWNAPQAIDPGLSMQQQFNYLTGGYGGNGIGGAIGTFSSAGGSTGIDNGAQAGTTLQDVANTDNAFLFMSADGALVFRERDNIANFPAGIAIGDMDYALNQRETFEAGLGPWTTTSSCTVAQSAGWSYAGKHSALVTVTGTPVQAYAYGDRAAVTPGEALGFSCWVMSPQGCTATAAIDFYNASLTYLSTASLAANVNCPPMTPAFLSLAGVTAPAGAAFAYPHPTMVSSPATGTQLYFDRARLSPAGFQVPYEGDVEITEDIQFLFNDIAVTRNVDQASYRARDTTSRSKYYPRIYPRTIYSSVDDLTAVTNCANFLVANFAAPALRVPHMVIDAAENPDAWSFVLSAGIGDSVSFTRTPVGGAAVTGTFTIISVAPSLAPDKAQFTYMLAPGGVF